MHRQNHIKEQEIILEASMSDYIVSQVYICCGFETATCNVQQNVNKTLS